MQTLVEPTVVDKWNKACASGSDKSYPNLDLVRLKHWFFGKEPGKLLEYGFGCGVNLLFLLEQGYQVEAIDAAAEAKRMVERKLEKRPELASKVRLRTIEVGTQRLPFEDETFDFITCVSVLSLLGSKDRVAHLLLEFQRVLKPGGKVIVDINGPNSDFARDGQSIGNDVYEYRGSSRTDSPNPCYCPPTAESFAALTGEYFKVDDVGFSHHKYFQSWIEEFIVCAHKLSRSQ